MIGFFPESHPDELLFSIISRYHARMGYRDEASTARDLFGKQVIRPSVDLPGNLGELVSRLPPGNTYSVSRLIDSHTLLPFYSPFVPAGRLEQIRADMEGSGGARIHSRLGINTFKGTPRTLKYCRGCVDSDRNIFGETYWHRLHQAAGVEVCPVHQNYLIDTGIQTAAWSIRDVLITAEEAIDPNTVSQEVSDEHFPTRLRIAEGASWLLQNPMGGSGRVGHRERYLRLFFERGACTYSGCFSSSFFEEVRAFYSDDFLEGIHCPLRQTDNWAQRLVRQEGRSQHPLYHLLLTNFLGLTVQQFFELPETRLPFGVGPWPCLNAASGHFGQDLITTYETDVTQRNGRTPRWTFRCGCGFAYSRIGPEKNENERYRVDRYVSFGDEWDSSVRQLFCSGEYSPPSLARKLKISKSTLSKQLVRLGLIPSTEEVAVKSDKRRKQITPEIFDQQRERNRDLYLKAVTTHLSRSSVSQVIRTVDIWLRRNDREWWLANAPPTVGHKPSSYIDWRDRDSKWAASVLEEAERIIALPGRPLRASKTAIARSLKITDVIIKRPEKVPLTIATLQKICESTESYALRRLAWAAQYYRGRDICPTRSQLCAKAAIVGKTSELQKVLLEVDAAMTQFQAQLGLNYPIVG